MNVSTGTGALEKSFDVRRERYMDKDTAEQLMARAKDCIQLLNQMVEIAMSNCNKDEERVVRHAVGYTLADLLDSLMVPLFREYPDLIPEGCDYGPLDGPTFTELAQKSRPGAPPGEGPKGNEP